MATPKLRFKEFDGDWTSKQLGKIIGISSASRVFKEQWQDSGVPFFRTSDVVSIFKNKENEKAYISLELFEELAKKSGKIKQGDLLVTGGGSIGIPYLVPNDQPLYFKDADLLWMKSSGIVEGSFLYNFFISPKFREYLKSISHTGTISHFTIEQAKATPFGFPSKEEQTKIASFLSAVDEKISQLTQKHELLSQYKQGMMQKLFSQQIRFKADDGSEFGEWEETTLGEIGTFKSGQGFPEQFQGGKDGIPFFKVSDMNILGNEKIMKVANNYVNSEAITKMKAKVIDNEAIIFAKVGAAIFLERKRLAKNFLIDNNMMAYLSNQKTNIMFLKQFLDNIKLSKFVQVGALPSYNSSDLAIIPISLPCLEEQTKIANFLSAIDQKLEVVAQQIEHAKTWKKGLLQQMFV
ncbi:restriction endonuclease subunit S [Acinetobacter baumannii]|uniref:restriction endonuclease subunit S n=1 Tax=Acinetobacter calcoaceticus/baumannii complex TaxID=909768 RepID=UPI000F77BB76|nr:MULTISPECIES: restriction endonuclease subunit S [Acinetobacter calcoaceticus/baumannii complex]MCR0011621.1 restriction endonuclease subunit S [Acinetobacter baumannii]MDN8173276.1 restriction endonuclease subunit S [Acinetobacter baumannii]MDQ9851418.1 restriction endonuclease subunit S [Acinetobacter baumannii]MDQ9998508.1 restriction endonuclease subunit S [Acinetobacter baumannii]QEY04056.1 type I restriction enzyme S subunit [Acinetobacter baumannii]